jgi:hypothetical protein
MSLEERLRGHLGRDGGDSPLEMSVIEDEGRHSAARVIHVDSEVILSKDGEPWV